MKKLALIAATRSLGQDVPGTASVYSERVAGGRYIKVDIQREKAARYGLNIADVQQVIASAIGGMNATQTVEGVERYPMNVRYPQDYRNSPEQLSLLPIVTMAGQRIALADVADIYIEDGPPAIKSENARLNGWSFIDIEGVDVGRYVAEAQKVAAAEIELRDPTPVIGWGDLVNVPCRIQFQCSGRSRLYSSCRSCRRNWDNHAGLSQPILPEDAGRYKKRGDCT